MSGYPFRELRRAGALLNADARRMVAACLRRTARGTRTARRAARCGSGGLGFLVALKWRAFGDRMQLNFGGRVLGAAAM